MTRGSPGSALQIPQADEQRGAKQRGRAEDEAEQETPELSTAARLFYGDRLDHGSSDQRMLAFDHAARHVIGHRIDDDGDIVRLREHDAAKTAVLHEAVDALVASHQYM